MDKGLVIHSFVHWTDWLTDWLTDSITSIISTSRPRARHVHRQQDYNQHITKVLPSYCIASCSYASHNEAFHLLSLVHNIFYHRISYHIISCHIKSCHVTLYHIVLLHSLTLIAYPHEQQSPIPNHYSAPHSPYSLSLFHRSLLSRRLPYSSPLVTRIDASQSSHPCIIGLIVRTHFIPSLILSLHLSKKLQASILHYWLPLYISLSTLHI